MQKLLYSISIHNCNLLGISRAPQHDFEAKKAEMMPVVVEGFQLKLDANSFADFEKCTR